MPERARLCAAVLLAAAGLAACGGGVSREDYAEQADKICDDLRQKFANVNRPSTTGQRTELTERLGRELDGTVRELKELERPGGEDGEKAKQFVDALERGVNQLKPALAQLQEAIASRDPNKLRQSAQRLQALEGEDIGRRAREIGANRCAGG